MPRINGGPPRISQQPIVKHELSRRLGSVAASRLMQQLVLRDKRFYLKLYEEHAGQPIDINGRKYMYPGMKNSPIIVGDHRDIAHYQISAVHPNAKDQGPQRMSFLENYLIVPTNSGKLILVSDTHNHALFGWALARELGITNRNSALVHVDAHYDDGLPFYSGTGIKVRLSRQTQDYIDRPAAEYESWGETQRNRVLRYSEDEGFLWSTADAHTLEIFWKYGCKTATERQAIKELYEHRRQYDAGRPGHRTIEDFSIWSRRYADIADFITPGDEVLFDSVQFVVTKNNGLGIKGNRGDLDGFRQGGQLVSIELMASQIRQLKAQGRKIILDLDIDYFAHYFQVERDSGTEAKDRITFEENFAQVLALAREADFITVATSPDWFADQEG
ncbi:MAG: UPF0489 family protein, partial [Nanoarchaeota archaeon]|nr:UPF0489 family protein [Nanoarchaeota archaeon]